MDKEKIYAKLRSLTSGQKIDTYAIKDEAKRAEYVECVKQFIDNGNQDIEFSNDYRFVKKLGEKKWDLFTWAEQTKQGEIRNHTFLGHRGLTFKYRELYVDNKIIAIESLNP